MFRAIKNLLLNTFIEITRPGVRVEKDVHINSRSYFGGLIHLGKKTRLCRGSALIGKISIGDYSYLNALADLQGAEARGITIGKFCSISRNVFITSTNNHNPETISNYPMRENIFGEASVDIGAPVNIGNDVWIGANAVILPGVEIGNGAVVGAGTVVSASTKILPYEVWAGVPARKLKDRFSADVRERVEKLDWWNWNKKEIQRHRELFTNPNWAQIDIK